MTLRHRFAATGLAAALALAPVAAVASSFVAAPAAQAAPSASQSASSAAAWLGTQVPKGYYASPTGQADIGATADVLIGLIAGGNNSAATSVDDWLKQHASEANGAGQTAKIAIAAEAMGEDPTTYGGHDLIGEVLGAVKDGNGSLGDPYSDSLALIAIKGSSDTVPDNLVTSLLKQQNAEGEFFFGSGAAAWPDPDTTGLAIQALDGVDGDDAGAALSKAVGWAVKNQASAGYWESSSPVNTTGLVASALAEQGKDVSKATTWMTGQQLKNGGLPNTLNGKNGDAYATAQGLLLLGGVTLNSVQLHGSDTTPTPTLPKPSLPKPTLPKPSLPTLPSLPSATLPSLSSATSTTSGSTPAPTTLPATGAEGDENSHAGDLGALAFGVVTLGAIGGGVALRNRRHS